jgi:amino acid transporter
MSEKNGSECDKSAMQRMGKRQELRVRAWHFTTASVAADQSVEQRNFRFLTIFCYGVLLGCTWEFALVSVDESWLSWRQSTALTIHSIISISLANGGTGGGIWMFLTVCFGMFFVTLSLAEMEDLPQTGGQYHWVSEIAPENYQRFLSYIVGAFLDLLAYLQRLTFVQVGCVSSVGRPVWRLRRLSQRNSSKA